MWIDLDDDESKPMLINISDNEGKPTGKKILITVFDLYSKEISDDTGIKRITTFAYEIRTSPDNATMLKKSIVQNIF